MPNMNYCKFENTYPDLQQCYDALQEAGSLENLLEDLSESEQKYAIKLVELCQKIADKFGKEIND